ncbi:hypothetical protein QBC32DRAFT_127199 [Pseudoneurospora amorphoporcata]|uniref:DUF7924 domain-containing protein n=1 Tax=Pseudoneurospora amorphoporcata TaxID=241081 RepID=A0AAN6SB50_9PEZI|nr:hypothetical protein QBC32DRAFT_127199 [Pseudoneurospora amorphoporcata]
MTLAVRGIVELFRVVKREDEINRKIFAFSVSHDHQSVRIYGHYPVITGKDTKYYRHPIRNFVFIKLDGKEKWTAPRLKAIPPQLPASDPRAVVALSLSTPPSPCFTALACSSLSQSTRLQRCWRLRRQCIAS